MKKILIIGEDAIILFEYAIKHNINDIAIISNTCFECSLEQIRKEKVKVIILSSWLTQCGIHTKTPKERVPFYGFNFYEEVIKKDDFFKDVLIVIQSFEKFEEVQGYYQNTLFQLIASERDILRPCDFIHTSYLETYKLIKKHLLVSQE